MFWRAMRIGLACEPLAKKGVITFLTFDEIAELYLRWENAR